MKNLLLIGIVLISSFGFGQNKEKGIDEMLDAWHHAAAVADGKTFFGSMTEDAHYIGTDEAEDWTRDEMMEWAKDIFKRDSA